MLYSLLLTFFHQIHILILFFICLLYIANRKELFHYVLRYRSFNPKEEDATLSGDHLFLLRTPSSHFPQQNTSNDMAKNILLAA